MTDIAERPTAAAAPAWLICGGCQDMLYGRRFERSGRVCPECGWHAPLTARQRLEAIFDAGTVEIFTPQVLPDNDPLEFTDTLPYPQRLAEARERTGLAEAVLCARGLVNGRELLTAVMDFRFLGGSLGSAVGEAITATCEMAATERVPLLLVTASGGARMQEGIYSLMQMVKTSQALERLDRAGVLTMSLVTDPTYGGVAASFATLTDVIIAEPGARMGFAGRRVIEQTIGQRLPAGFQTAEFLMEHGMIDVIAHRGDLRPLLTRLLTLTDIPDPGDPPLDPVERVDPVVRDPELLPDRTAWDVVRAARDIARPTTLEHAAMILDDFVELHGDRMGEDCPALVGGPGRLGGVPVMLIGTQKGHDAAELAARNYGMPRPSGYRKAARLMRTAAKLGLPVLTLIDTAGAYPGIAAEEQGQSFAISENLRLMAGLPVPVVAVVTGEGGSGGALALAVADEVLICSNAVYSVISPEGCAAILWKDPTAAPQAAQALRVDARRLLSLGVVDGVVTEPGDGAHTDHLAAATALADALTLALRRLRPLSAAELDQGRHARFRAFGRPDPATDPHPDTPLPVTAPAQENAQ